MRELGYLGELEFEAEMETVEQRFGRTHPGGVIESDESLDLNNYLVDSVEPRAEHLSAIRRAAVRLAATALSDNTFAIQIVGHASSSGSAARNLRLSRLRARRAAGIFISAFRSALVSRGFSLPEIEQFVGLLRDRMTVRGVGASDPAISPAKTAADLARNRRVEIFVTAQA